MAEGRLKGDIAVVTGSDSGIGQATATAFAREGADVAVTWLHDEAGADHTRRAVEAEGQRAFVTRFDQRDEEEVVRLFRETRENLGVPTILVNNAGVDARGKPVKDMSLNEWNDDIATNLTGPFLCAREFVRNISGSGKEGAIINVSSIHKTVPRAGAVTYDVAKAGIHALTVTLALELAEEGITVNTLAPGMVLTPFNQKAIDDEEFREKTVQSIPMKRAAAPGEIASAAVFLASKEARYVHGSTLTVDGALTLFQAQGA